MLWPLAVLPAAAGHAWPGVLAGAAFAGGHLAATPRDARGREALVVAVALVLGGAAEAAIGALGLVRYDASWAAAPWLPPAWILALWAAVGALPSSLLAWLRGRPVLAAVVGAVGGSLSLRAGAVVGAVALASPAQWVPAVALEWAVLTPLLVELSGRLDPGARRD